MRGIFAEGEPAYPGAAFDAKTHVQIAVRNADCIKGVSASPSDIWMPGSRFDGRLAVPD